MDECERCFFGYAVFKSIANEVKHLGILNNAYNRVRNNIAKSIFYIYFLKNLYEYNV